jgi:polyferredoxin
LKREEWELVRELLKQNNSMTGEESTMMRHFQTELSQHDNKERKKLKKQQEKRSRDEWLHRNMGLIMYPVDIFMDLIYSVIPHPHKNKSLVSALS